MREGSAGVDAQVRSLLDLSNAGVFTLPPEIIKAQAGVVRLEAERKKAIDAVSKVDPDVLRDELGKALVSAATRGTKLPNTADQVVEAVRAREAATITKGAVEGALDTMLNRRNATVQQLGETITTDHLRPALGDLLKVGERAVKDLHGLRLDATRREVAEAPTEAQRAIVVMDDLGGRYSQLRSAYRLLELLGVKPQYDNRFGEFENFDELWPRAGALGGATEPPWPSDPGGRMHWILTTAAKPWMPTPAQRDEVYAAFVERNKADFGARARRVS